MHGRIPGGDIGRAHHINVLAQRDGIDYNLAFIPVAFHPKRTSEFDTHYMNQEFELAYNPTRSGYKWSKYPPGFVSADQQATSNQQVQA